MTQTFEVSKSHQTGAPSTSAGLLSSPKLTFRQQEVFDLLVAYINQHGYPPTLSELADMLGVSSSNAVLLHLRALERKKFYKTLSPCLQRNFHRRAKGAYARRAAAAGNDR